MLSRTNTSARCSATVAGCLLNDAVVRSGRPRRRSPPLAANPRPTARRHSRRASPSRRGNGPRRERAGGRQWNSNERSGARQRRRRARPRPALRPFSTPSAYAPGSTPPAAGRHQTAHPRAVGSLDPALSGHAPSRRKKPMPLIALLRPDSALAAQAPPADRQPRADAPHPRRHGPQALMSRVDLPIEAGTCGRLIPRESSRYIRCHNRRR